MIDILMAAYNGEKYIKRQIESIIAQTYRDWRLIIQDDCSTDRTVNIVNEYAKQYPQKINLYINKLPSGSAKNNFFDILKYVENDYIMFCDQDDVWLENKIELSINFMKQKEKAEGDIPLLIHTDLAIVDSELNIFKNSFFKYQGLDWKAVTLNKLLVQNNVTGCTVLINKNLLSLIKGRANDALMHDWWIALVASSFGKIFFIEKATVLYRQHGNNQLGAVNNRNILKAFKIILNGNKTVKRVSVTYLQAGKYLAVYKENLSQEDLNIIKDYASIPNLKKIKRIKIIIKCKYLKQNTFAKIGQLIYC